MSPTVVHGNRQYRDSIPPPDPSEEAHLAEVRQWRMASLGISEDDLIGPKDMTPQHQQHQQQEEVDEEEGLEGEGFEGEELEGEELEAEEEGN